MTKLCQIMLLMLPGLLVSLRGNFATPIQPSVPEIYDSLFEDESPLTRFEEVNRQDKSDQVLSESVIRISKNEAIDRNSHRVLQESGFKTFQNQAMERNGRYPENKESRTQNPPLLKSFFSNNGSKQTNRWGSHPIGTRDSFVLNDSRLKWIAYFYDQAIAAVLQTQNGTMVKCTVQENIQKWEQKAALRYLGEIMPLQPIPFSAMVHLITICGTLNMPLPQENKLPNTNSHHLWWLDVSALQGILPGTLWCGMQDRATYYHQLGPRSNVDSCCRAHDHCPIKLSSLTTRYGVTNMGIKTLSHCSCDLEFFRCLKAAGSDTSRMVGNMYFNYLDMKCLDAPPLTDKNKRNNKRSSANSSHENRDKGRSLDGGRLDCVRVDREGGCRKWVMRPKDFSVQLVVTQLGLNF